MLNGLDLFSGIGGISIALSEWVSPIAYCEIDTYCQGVLLSRMQMGELARSPIWDDIRSLDGRELFGKIDIISGGFPCQDISVAGRGKGLAGERSGLFFEIVRLAKAIKPPFLFLENVPAIATRGGVTVVRTLAEVGYDCRWCVISAASIGALHRRERWFLLGYAKHFRRDGTEERGGSEEAVHNKQKRQNQASESSGAGASRVLAAESVSHANGESECGLPVREEVPHASVSKLCKYVADSSGEGLEGIGTRTSSTSEKEPLSPSSSSDVADTESEQSGGICECRSQPHPFNGSNGRFEADWWQAEPDVGRVANGVLQRMDRLKALGNAVVPVQAKEAFKILMGFK
jgi:DNA (cytosine-5)-methyltransferase 1